MIGARFLPTRRFCRLLFASAVLLNVLGAGGCDRTGADSTPASGAQPAAHGSPAPVSQWLTDITELSGLDFVHESGATGQYFTPEITGPGGALFDYDQDGDLDVYLITGNWSLSGDSHSTKPVNRLFRQDTHGHYTDVTDLSGLGDDGYGMGAAIGDIDNDGDLDVFVTNVGPDHLYRNRGDGTFENITAAAGIRIDGWSASAGFFDYDRDGWLDLFITRYMDFNTTKRCFDAAGRPDYCAPSQFPPLHDVLLHNNGDGTFTDASDAAGISAVAARGLGLAFEDFDDDGWIDVYVANDGDPNHLWINQRDGTFREMAVALGAAFDIHGRPQAGMGLIAADLNDDLKADVFVTNFTAETNTLYVNRGAESGFDDASASSGLINGCINFTGFGTVAFDVELDGDLDIAIVNGATLMEPPMKGTALRAPWNRYAEPNLFYLNRGDGVFSLNPPQCASFCRRIEISRGLIDGDIDGDGDMDLLVTTVQGPARLYRNDAPRQGGWVCVQCIDPRLNRDAVGARLIAHIGPRQVRRMISSAGSFMSARPPVAHFGLGEFPQIDTVEVRWPDGFVEQFGPLPAGKRVKLVRGEGTQP